MTFDDWPIYFKERLLLGNPESVVGIATCWTPKEAVASTVPADRYLVMGQLYTKRGVNHLLRNILAKPQIHLIYVVGQDFRGGGEALIGLVNNGVEEKEGKKLIKGVENGYIDEQVTIEAIEAFRANVKVVDLRGQNTITNDQLQMTNDQPSFWRGPETFPEAEVATVETAPSEQTVFTIRRGLISEAWVEILKHVLKFGSVHPTLYGGTKKELLNVVAIVDAEDAEAPVTPSFMNTSQSDVASYIANVFSPTRGEEPYTYGERLMSYDPAETKLPPFPINQIELMTEKLKRYPAEVGALAVLWQPEVDNFDTRKPWRTPCLTLIQGVIRNNTLLLTAYFRSNDMFGAWHLNAWALRHLQQQITGRLGCKVGTLTTISHCAHIYDNALAEVAKVVAENDKLSCRTDPRGNFVIDVTGNTIKVNHLSPDGLLLKEYAQDASLPGAAQTLGNKIVQDLGISEISHALDFGAQLARAEESIRHHLKFTQDRPLQNL